MHTPCLAARARRHCRVVQCGQVLQRLVPRLLPGAFIGDHLELRLPYISWSFDLIAENCNTVFALCIRPTHVSARV